MISAIIHLPHWWFSVLLVCVSTPGLLVPLQNEKKAPAKLISLMSLAGASPLGALLLLPKELLRCHFKLDANLVVPAHLDPVNQRRNDQMP